MRIPAQFKIINRTYTVHVDTEESLIAGGAPKEIKDLKGRASNSDGRLDINLDQHLCWEDVEHTFCHELVHALYFALGKDEHDEKEVDLLGALIQQYEQSKSGHHKDVWKDT